MAYPGNRVSAWFLALCAPFFLGSFLLAGVGRGARASTRAASLRGIERNPIAHAHNNETFSWMLFSAHGFVLRDLDDLAHKTILMSSFLAISHVQKALFFNGKKLSKKRLVMTPVSGLLWVQGKEIAGSLLLLHDERGVQLIQYCAHESPTRLSARAMLAPYVSEKLSPAVPIFFSEHPALKSVELEQLETLEKQKAIASVPKERQHTVRVLLGDLGPSGGSWRVRVPDGFSLAVSKYEKGQAYRAHEIEVRIYNQKLFLNGQSLRGTQCLITPVNEEFFFGGMHYQGSLLLTRDRAGHWLLINCLDLEAYTASVLGSESWPGWPLEVNKVFAIVSRTYAIAMIMSARAAKRPYHIKNTNQHQTYRGMHEIAVFKEAVAQTKGVFIAYKRRPIIAMFDACCGGIIPAHRAGIDFVSAPYLAREYACTFCRACKIYSWEARYSLAALEKVLIDELGGGVRGLQDIRVHKKDKAGLVQSLSVKSRRATLAISGKRIYSLLKQVKSFCYTVRKEGHAIVFKGRGYGHHLGLCQWGAREMVRQGYAYPEIVRFYYPGTTLARLP